MKHHEIIDRYEEFFVTRILLDGGRCSGVVARDIRDGQFHLFNAKSVILASGGAGQVFQPTTNALICTGDGIAQAYRVGAPLMDMEMIQYHPTTLVENGFLITEGARGEGAHLLNSNGERFMEKYAPNKMELASRDVVSRAEQTEISEGRGCGPNKDGVYLDITTVPRKRILEALREIVNIGKDFAGVDITREPILVRPGMHYIMGGVQTDINGQTSVPGLYAAGEVACVSVHGGNRLGANSLLDTLIFGRRAGADAGRQSQGMGFPNNNPSELSKDRDLFAEIIARPKEGRRMSEIKTELGQVMNDHVAVFRDEGGMRSALNKVLELKEESKAVWTDDKGEVFNQDVLAAVELGYMIDVAEAICRAALDRRESRGAHTRLDFTERNDQDWLKHILVRQGNMGQAELDYSPVTITDWQPEVRTY